MAEEIAEIQNYIFLNSIIPLKTIVLGKKLHAVLRLLIARYCFIKLHYGKYYMYECCTDVFSQYTVPWKKTEVRHPSNNSTEGTSKGNNNIWVRTVKTLARKTNFSWETLYCINNFLMLFMFACIRGRILHSTSHA